MSEQALQVGDILEWADGHSSVHRWRVNGIHLGAIGAESLIEMESITHKPGWTGEWEWHPVVWVPEVLCRRLHKTPAGKEGFGGTQYLRRAVYFLSEYDRLKKENNGLSIVHAPVQLELPF